MIIQYWQVGTVVIFSTETVLVLVALPILDEVVAAEVVLLLEIIEELAILKVEDEGAEDEDAIIVEIFDTGVDVLITVLCVGPCTIFLVNVVVVVTAVVTVQKVLIDIPQNLSIVLLLPPSQQSTLLASLAEQQSETQRFSTSRQKSMHSRHKFQTYLRHPPQLAQQSPFSRWFPGLQPVHRPLRSQSKQLNTMLLALMGVRLRRVTFREEGMSAMHRNRPPPLPQQSSLQLQTPSRMQQWTENTGLLILLMQCPYSPLRMYPSRLWNVVHCFTYSYDEGMKLDQPYWSPGLPSLGVPEYLYRLDLSMAVLVDVASSLQLPPSSWKSPAQHRAQNAPSRYSRHPSILLQQMPSYRWVSLLHRAHSPAVNSRHPSDTMSWHRLRLNSRTGIKIAIVSIFGIYLLFILVFHGKQNFVITTQYWLLLMGSAQGKINYWQLKECHFTLGCFFVYNVGDFVLLLQRMKKLIENNIVAKSFRFIDSSHNLGKSQLLADESESEHNCQPNLPTTSEKNKSTHHLKVPVSKPKSAVGQRSALKEKYNAQQVSALYSEHIYKSAQRDFMMEAQVEKYRLMLESEKKQKMQLLREQKELKIQAAKLVEQKQIILFALDSLTVKLDQESHSKKNKQIRRQTAEFIMSKFSGLEKKREGGEERLNTDPQSASVSGSECLTTPGHRQHGHQEGRGVHWDKMKIIRNLKQQLSLSDQCQIQNIVLEQQKSEARIAQLEKEISESKQKIKEIEGRNKCLTQVNEENQAKIIELEIKQKDLSNNMRQANEKLSAKTIQNYTLSTQIKSLKQNQAKLIAQKQVMAEKVRSLQMQLKITQEEFNEREQKEKKSVQVLQKFSKDLKLSDEKIQLFLKEEFSGEDSGAVTCTKKTYNEQLSYILHLYKKKQALYENIVTEFNDKMKEDDFRVSLLQKKISNYSKYQQELRHLVANQSDKDTVFRKILRFGY